MPKPEQEARERIDAVLQLAGWLVQDRDARQPAAPGGASPCASSRSKGGHGFADYLLYVDGKAVGVDRGEAGGHDAHGRRGRSRRSTARVCPTTIPAPVRPLPFLYESTGVETRFTNRLDPEPRSRRVFSFHRPETLADWLGPSVGPSAHAEGR